MGVGGLCLGVGVGGCRCSQLPVALDDVDAWRLEGGCGSCLSVGGGSGSSCMRLQFPLFVRREGVAVAVDVTVCVEARLIVLLLSVET